MALTGHGAISTEWVLLSLALSLVALRLYVRILKQTRKLLISDYMLMLSAVSALGLVTCDTLTYKHGALDNPDVWNVPVGKIAFAGNYFYDVGLYFPKLSIITIYHKLFPPSTISLQMRIWLYALSLYTVAACITTFCVDTFWCAPNIASNWSMDEGACSSFNSNTLFQLNWALNVSSDILIFSYPFPLLAKLQIDRRRLVALIFTFALGAITIVVSITRYTIIRVSNEYVSIYIWSMAEESTAIMVVCLPSLRVLIRRPGEKGSSSGGDTRSKSASRWTRSASRLKSAATHKFNTITSSTSNAGQIPHEADDGGSEVELNVIKNEAIYKTDEIKVFSSDRPRTGLVGESAELGNTAVVWA